MAGERRLRTLVLVERLTAETVAATAGREVVERLLQSVAAEEPFEGAGRPQSVLGRTRDREGRKLRLDERCGVERLVVAGALVRLAPVAAVMPGPAQHSAAAEAGLVADPAQRLVAELGQVVWSQCVAAADQRLREARVVVRELVLEPAPTVGGGAAVRVRELVDEPLEEASRAEVEAVGVEARQAEDRIGRRPQRDLSGERADESREQIPDGDDEGGNPGGRQDLAECPGGAADVIAGVRFVEPASVVAHEVAHS